MKIETLDEDQDEIIDTDDIEPGSLFSFIGDGAQEVYIRIDDEEGSIVDEPRRGATKIQAVNLASGYCWRRESVEEHRRAVLVDGTLKVRR